MKVKGMPNKIFLIHWNAREVEDYAAVLRKNDTIVETESEDGARAYKKIKAEIPDAVVIYLNRLPSHGRWTAVSLRSVKTTHDIPIIFVNGSNKDIEKTKEKVPDAIYTTSGELDSMISKILQR
jgi:response regulator RpfG family c-di-GMP phosphodiesterase